MVVDPGMVAEFLGWADPDPDTVTMLAHHLDVISGLVAGWTRGRGFTDGWPTGGDLGGVIIAATARLASNPAQYTREEVDGYAVTGGFNGWTLAEQAVLNRYRRRAA